MVLVDAQVQGNQDKLGKIGMGLMLRRGDQLFNSVTVFGTRWARKTRIVYKGSYVQPL